MGRGLLERTGLSKHYDREFSAAFDLQVANSVNSGKVGYDAAGSNNKRRANPAPHRNSADQVLDLSNRAKSLGAQRQVFRNFSIANWMVRCHVDYVADHRLFFRTPDRKWNKEAQQWFEAWFRPGRCDVAGIHPFERIIRIAEGRRVVDHDCGLMTLSNGWLQGIESDLIRQPEDTAALGLKWEHGVGHEN